MPLQTTRGGRSSFTGALERPLQILPGGYLSWIDPADSGLYRLDAGQREPELIADLARLAASTAPLRTAEALDSLAAATGAISRR